MQENLLEINHLKIQFSSKSNLFSRSGGNDVKAVDDVSLVIRKNQIHGLVGESGSGKSTLGRSIMGLNRISSGEILFHGKNLSKMNRKNNGVQIQMIFQDPNSSLPPNMRIEAILSEPIIINKLLPLDQIPNRVKELLYMVDLSEEYLTRFPHQLSGGQKQRIAVARAMAMNPELIVADEPTSALDVSVQAQILNLLLELKEKQGLSILFISHNLSVIRHLSDYISVMKQGKIVEHGTADDIFYHAQNDYTKKLIATIPHMKLKEEEYEE